MSALTSTVYTDLFQCLEGWKKYNSVDKYCPHGFVSASGGLKKYFNVPHCTVHMFVAARDGVERCVALYCPHVCCSEGRGREVLGVYGGRFFLAC